METRRLQTERNAYQTTTVYGVASESRPGHWYRVELVANWSGVRAHCNCPAAEHGRPCKHAAAVERLAVGEVRRQARRQWSNVDIFGPRMERG